MTLQNKVLSIKAHHETQINLLGIQIPIYFLELA